MCECVCVYVLQSLDNNLKLLLMLEVFQFDHEKFVKVCADDHSLNFSNLS